MKRMQRAALLTKLITELRDHRSWCGETHIQKAVYFAQYLTKIPMRYDFILYKHGPFSFDLRDELTALRADELLELEPRQPYGARMVPTSQSMYIQKFYPKTLGRYQEGIRFTARTLGDKGVVELERMATALYISKESGVGQSKKDRAERMTSLKPHISMRDALDAIREVDRISEEAPLPTALAGSRADRA